MSWMGDIAVMIEDAATYGVTLEVSDFRRLGNRLVIDGMDPDDWFAAVIRALPQEDRIEEMEW